MDILGISFLGDCGVALLRDGVLLEAVNEERFTRIKLRSGLPYSSIRYLFDKYKLTWSDLISVATHGKIEDPDTHLLSFKIKDQEIIDANISNRFEQQKRLWERYSKEKNVREFRTPMLLESMGKFRTDIQVYPHQACHAASSFHFSPFEEAYILTADGWGEDGSASFSYGKGNEIHPLVSVPSISSLGYFYGSITKYLGFTPHRHEGKVMALAAHGNPKVCYPILSQMIGYNVHKKSFDGYYEKGIYLANFDNPNLKKVLHSYSREDISAAAQKILEECVTLFLKEHFSQGAPLCVAGGIFSNVKLNEKILENTDQLFVFPHMGDGGLSAGAAALCYAKSSGKKTDSLSSLYLGSEYSDEEIVQAIIGFGFIYEKPVCLAKTIASVLAEGNPVAHFYGRMEYGPRALGNRSVLCPSNDLALVEKLNQALRRDDFMPFAPVTLFNEASKYYKNIESYYPNIFSMTTTVQCTEYCKKMAPAVIHYDDTARPQLVRSFDNPRLYEILENYFNLTGFATLINTSFNLHEEPIVESPKDALLSFKESKLGYLAIGSYLVHSNS